MPVPLFHLFPLFFIVEVFISSPPGLAFDLLTPKHVHRPSTPFTLLSHRSPEQILPLHRKRAAARQKNEQQMSTSVRIAAKNATNLAGFGLKLGTSIPFLVQYLPPHFGFH